MNDYQALVIGAGFAGCEAAMQLARAGIRTVLYEMKPHRYSPAHQNPDFAELICSNSFKAQRIDSAAGLMKEEMTRFGSLCVSCARETQVPAGGSLSVNREDFSRLVTETVEAEPLLTICREEVTDLTPVLDRLRSEDDPLSAVVVAAGPLASDALADSMKPLVGESLHFFDAVAPIVSGDSVDMDKAFCQSRYDRGGADDYINCPMNKAEYEAFYEELVHAERAELHAFEKGVDVYEGCMPIEVMASRGPDTIRYGPLKPVGLRDPRTGHRPWAALQLRKETTEGDMYNLVGFQTNLKFGEQKRVFRMIPGLEHAEFLRYGVMHRNTYLQSPELLDADFGLRTVPGLYFAGQITGVEGYMESAMSGILAGRNAARRIQGIEPLILPTITMMGALANYISDPSVTRFQPMGANFGVLPALPERIRDKRERYGALAARSLTWLDEHPEEWN